MYFTNYRQTCIVLIGRVLEFNDTEKETSALFFYATLIHKNVQRRGSLQFGRATLSPELLTQKFWQRIQRGHRSIKIHSDNELTAITLTNKYLGPFVVQSMRFFTEPLYQGLEGATTPLCVCKVQNQRQNTVDSGLLKLEARD